MTGGAATGVRCIAKWARGMVALFSMEERKHDLSFVMQRIAAGDCARFFHSHFGQQEVELSRSWIWIFKRKTRVSLPSPGDRTS